jgi:hypothetical protein
MTALHNINALRSYRVYSIFMAMMNMISREHKMMATMAIYIYDGYERRNFLYTLGK